jgi:hypothetical protein
MVLTHNSSLHAETCSSRSSDINGLSWRNATPCASGTVIMAAIHPNIAAGMSSALENPTSDAELMFSATLHFASSMVRW